MPYEGPGDICGTHRGGEYPLPLRLHKGEPYRFEKGHRVAVGEVVEGRTEEVGDRMDMGGELSPWAVVGDIATPFPRNVYLLSAEGVLLEQGDAAPRLGPLYGGHHPGGPAACHYYVEIQAVHSAITPLPSISPSGAYQTANCPGVMPRWGSSKTMYMPPSRAISLAR